MGDAIRCEDRYAEAALEQRSAPRFTLLIRAAKLVTPVSQFLCVIRDASETGISVRTFHSLPQCEEMIIELQNGDRYPAAMVWQEEGRAGLRFTRAVDIGRIIECPSDYGKRAIRLEVEAPAQITCLAGKVDVSLHNLSQQGASITSRVRFSLDQRVKISAWGLPETSARVRWRKHECFGLAFEDTYQFAELARIARMLQRPS
jgi:hypothetical protein